MGIRETEGFAKGLQISGWRLDCRFKYKIFPKCVAIVPNWLKQF